MDPKESLEDSACSYIVANVTVPLVYFSQAIIFSLEFLLSVVGLILNILFLCQKSTTFFERIFVYVSIAVTPLVGISWLLGLPALLERTASVVEFCEYIATQNVIVQESSYILWSTTVLSFSANFGLLLILSYYTFTCCGSSHEYSRSSTCRLCCKTYSCTTIMLVVLELVCITITFVLPILFAITVFEISQSHEEYTTTITDVISKMLYVFPGALGFSFFSGFVLIIWYYIHRKFISRRSRQQIVIKQGLFTLHLLVTLVLGLYCGLIILGILKGLPGPGIGIGMILVVTLLSAYPLCAFIYMYMVWSSSQQINTPCVTAGNQVTAHPTARFTGDSLVVQN